MTNPILTEHYDGVVTCTGCGRTLTAERRVMNQAIEVEPCSFCMNPPAETDHAELISRAISILQQAK